MNEPLLETIATAHGEVRVRKGELTELIYEYEESGRVLRASWDPRETDVSFYVLAEQWSLPAGAPIDDAARARILEALWAATRQRGGAEVLFESNMKARCLVARHWTRTDRGFLLDVWDRGDVTYFEIGRTLDAKFDRDANDQQVARFRHPAAPAWNYPPGQPMTPADLARVLANVASATPKDFRAPVSVRKFVV